MKYVQCFLTTSDFYFTFFEIFTLYCVYLKGNIQMKYIGYGFPKLFHILHPRAVISFQL